MILVQNDTFGLFRALHLRSATVGAEQSSPGRFAPHNPTQYSQEELLELLDKIAMAKEQK